ncbi:hypothetical protein KIH39_21440 [Telmatocola sphagniphila]|uniref:Uncharacterized protein n=1 Tax=Telmatocola sphagniphila TaxID=1123043 RepID=A0A8E6ESU5_9BACT|nr:hypothetical protein [Telmatocola sphagniphila]QVL31384.1 hypothetical protein KIH39_21440 [Telmatocola sphagniphila]
MKSDYVAARALLAPQTQQDVSIEKITAEEARMHPKTKPAEVSAIEFEPISGQRAINIFLKGQQGVRVFLLSTASYG